MKNVVRGAAIGAVAALIPVLAGCVATAQPTPNPEASEASETIVIGAAMAETGFMSVVDLPALNSLRIAVDELNKSGGIDGTPVELRVVDTGSDLAQYAPAAQQLVDAGAKTIVLTCDYDIASPGALVAERAGVLNISPCVADALWGPTGGLELGFSLGNATLGEGAIMAEFAFDQGWQNAVFLTDTSLKYSQNECEYTQARYAELGGTQIANYDYVQGDSIPEIVSKIASGSAPDVIFNCGYNPGGAQVAKDLRDGGITTPVVSGFGMDGTFWLDAIPGLSDYYVVTYALSTGDDPNPKVNEFAALYEEAYGERPTTSTFLTGPSVLETIVTAHSIAESWDGAKLADALETVGDLDLLAGPTKFSSEYHIGLERPQSVLVVQDGSLVFVERRAPQSVNVQ